MQENSEENIPSLTHLQKRGLIQILVNACDALSLLTKITPLNGNDMEETEYKPKTVLERIKSHAYLKIYDELDRAIYHSTPYDREAKKLCKERCFILNFFQNFKNELIQNESPCPNILLKTLEYVENIEAEETQVIEEARNNLKTIKQLKTNIRLQTINCEVDVADTDKIVRSAADVQRSLETENNVKMNFVEKWNKCRIYQNNLRGFMTLSKKVEETEKAQEQIQNENTVHRNIIKFEELFTKDLNKKLAEMIDIYNKQTVEKDEQIADIIEKTQQQFEELTKLKTEYERKLNSINDWLNEKAEMKRQADLEERRRLAATRIQSWWRMLMVRKGFGPFKLKLLAKNKKKGKGKK